MEDFPWAGSLPFFVRTAGDVGGGRLIARPAFIPRIVIRFHSRILMQVRAVHVVRQPVSEYRFEE